MDERLFWLAARRPAAGAALRCRARARGARVRHWLVAAWRRSAPVARYACRRPIIRVCALVARLVLVRVYVAWLLLRVGDVEIDFFPSSIEY